MNARGLTPPAPVTPYHPIPLIPSTLPPDLKDARPQELIARVAAEQIGVRETSSNQGPGISKFWDATTYPEGDENREPWCSAFASWCVQEADRRSPLLKLTVPPTFPAVSQWLPWANRWEVEAKVFQSPTGSPPPLAGDIVIFLPHFSHVGIVESYADGVVTTIEGNTNDAGDRDGGAVLRKRRLLSICGSFIRMAALGVPA
jgi:hypothetical protein